MQPGPVFFGILNCVNGNLNRSDVRVFNLRQNNISTLNVTTLDMYPNLKIVDLWDNPLRCTSINIKDLVIRSDSPMPTILQSTTSYQDNLHSSPVKTFLIPPRPITLHETSLQTSLTQTLFILPRATTPSQMSLTSQSSPEQTLFVAPRPTALDETSQQTSLTQTLFILPLATTPSQMSLTSQSSPAQTLFITPQPTIPYQISKTLHPSKPKLSSLQTPCSKRQHQPTSVTTPKTYFVNPAPNTSSAPSSIPYNKPTISTATYQHRSHDLIYLSTSICTVVILVICFKFKLYTRCRRNSHQLEQHDETSNMSPMSMSCSGSSTYVYSTTSV